MKPAAWSVQAASAVHGGRNGSESCGQRLTVRRAHGIPCALLVLIVCSGFGCQRKPDLPTAAVSCPVATDVQIADRNVYVDLPDRVTRPVVDLMPAESQTWGQAKADADRRGELLRICNGQLREARYLGGSPVE